MYFHRRVILFAATALLSALGAAGEPNPHNCETDNGNGVVCKTRVKITCKTTIGGVDYDCLNPDDANLEPWKTFNSKDCGIIKESMEFRMCNDNDKEIVVIPEETRFKYMAEELKVDQSKIVIQPNQCRTKFIDRSVDTCRLPKMRPMSVLFNARLINDPADTSNTGDNAYCFCYTYKRSTFNYIGPVIEPPYEPLVPCLSKTYVITEVVNPTNPDARYIEIYNGGCKSATIEDRIKIVRYQEGKGEFEDLCGLQDVTIRQDGFIIICRNKQKINDFYGRDICDIEVPDLLPNNGGKGTYAVYDTYGNSRIDTYGSKDPMSNRSEQDITNGRADRLTCSGESYWIPDEWKIVRGGALVTDPREWDGTFGPVVGPKPPVVGPKPIITNHPIITEIYDEDKEVNPHKFVELYFPACSKGGCTILLPYKLCLYKGAQTMPSINGAFDLQNKQTDANGFLVVCNIAGSGCDYVHTSPNGMQDGPTQSDGHDQIAIIFDSDDTGAYKTNIDVFGKIGEDGEDTDHDFEDARCIRKVTKTSNNEGTWNANDWIIYKNSNSIVDPGEWNPIQPADIVCQFIITEIADPMDEQLGRFVEIFTPNCGGKRFPIDIHLVHWKPGDNKGNPSGTIDLGKIGIPMDGIFVICGTAACENLYAGDTCDLVPTSSNNAATNEGDEAIAIISGPVTNFIILDIYGVIGNDGFETESNFKDGHCIRKKTCDGAEPSPIWDLTQWVIVPGKGSGSALIADCHPGVWDNWEMELIITEVGDPQDGDDKNRFCVLYSPNGGRNQPIPDDLYLRRWKGAAINHDENYKLGVHTLNDNGSLVICKIGHTWPTGTCDLELGEGSVVDNEGIDRIAIVKCNTPTSCVKVDVFGYPPGEITKKADHDYSNGVAYRLRGYDIARSVWVRNEWRVITSIDSAKCTPGTNAVTNPNPDPATDIPDGDGVICTQRADKLWFKFTGGLCEDSENDQGVRRGRRLKGGKGGIGGNGNPKFICAETNFKVTAGEKVDIDINAGDFKHASKVIGDYILVQGDPSTGKTTTPTNMDVIITRLESGGGQQLVTLHSSCSGALAIGQTFGSFMFVGFENSGQGPVGYKGR